jgi:hypothetical protein
MIQHGGGRTRKNATRRYVYKFGNPWALRYLWYHQVKRVLEKRKEQNSEGLFDSEEYVFRMRGDFTEIVITRLFKGRTSSMIMKPIAAIPPKILVDYFTVKNDGKSARTLTHVPASHSAAEPLKAIFELFIRKLQTTPSIVERIVQYTLKKKPRIGPEMIMKLDIRPEIDIPRTNDEYANEEVETSASSRSYANEEVETSASGRSYANGLAAAEAAVPQSPVIGYPYEAVSSSSLPPSTSSSSSSSSAAGHGSSSETSMSAHPPLTLKQRIERSRLVHGGEEEGDVPESAFRATAAGGGVGGGGGGGMTRQTMADNNGHTSNASAFKMRKQYTRKISRV